MVDDQGGTVSVLKDATSYPLWKMEIGILFASQALGSIVDGVYTEAHAKAISDAEGKKWVISDAKAKRSIMTSLTPEVKQHILTCQTSHAMLTTLAGIYEESNENLKIKLMQEFFEVAYDPSKSVIDNISKVRNIAYRLNALNETVNDNMIISKILNILPTSFKYFACAWDSATDKSLEQLCARLQREESKLNEDKSDLTSVAFAAVHQRPRLFASKCYGCGRQGHRLRDCHDKKCTICKRNNHSTSQCFYNKGQLKPQRPGGSPVFPPCDICKRTNHPTSQCFHRHKSSGPQWQRWNQKNQHLKRKVDFSRDKGDDNYQSKRQKGPTVTGAKKVSFMAVSNDESKQVSTSCKELKDATGLNESKELKVATGLNNNKGLTSGEELKGDLRFKHNKAYTSADKVNRGEGLKLKLCKKSSIANSAAVQVSPLQDSTSTKQKSFTVDSGANKHMTPTVEILTNVKPTNSLIKTAKKENIMICHGVGDVESESCTLTDVHFVPELNRNLFSVNGVTTKEGAVYFYKGGVKILKQTVEIPDDAVVLTGIQTTNGLFEVNLDDDHEANLSHVSQNEEITEWHRKMGHLGTSNLRLLSTLCTGMNISTNHIDIGPCMVCAQAKQTKRPHAQIRARASRVLEIIHTDVVGPITPETYDKKRYFVTFIDDYSHYCQVYLLTYKSEVFRFLKKYVKESCALHMTSVHKIRCDNGGEYVSQEVREWCEQQGIILDYTIPGCPSLNGTGERMNRTVVGRGRALLFDSPLNNDMWGEAICTAAYLINRSPTKAVPGLPAELWFSQKQDLSGIHLFGSTVTAKRTTHLKKLDSRVRVGIMVGYAPHGYRLWDQDKREIFTARDVVFHPHPQVSDRKEINRRVFQVVGIEEDLDLQPIPDNIEEQIHPHQEEPDNIDQPEDPCDAIRDQQNPPHNLRDRRELKAPSRFEQYELYLCYGSDLPLTFSECIKIPQWEQAIKEEMTCLEKNRTWDLIDAKDAIGKTIINSRWVFTIKNDGRYKARLVAKGFQQRNTSDKNNFSPVVDSTNLRILMALAASNSMKIVTFDVKTAFLNGFLDEPVLMEIPEGFHHPGKVCRLKKALYGLNQAPQRWYKRLSAFLQTVGLEQLKTDRCVYKSNNCSAILAIHVDDGIIFSADECTLHSLLTSLEKEFDITVDFNPKVYLGMEIVTSQKGIFLSQTTYTNSILKTYQMENSKATSTPLEPQKEQPIPSSSKRLNFPYRQAVGSLQHLASKTRPDISFAVNFVSRFMQEPEDKDVINVKRILRYLQGTRDLGLFFSSESSMTLDCYSDSDYAGSGHAGKFKSTSGYVIKLSGAPITWHAKKQEIVAMSVCEAEYISAALCCQTIKYVKSFIFELTGENMPAVLKVDNQSALKLIKNGQMHSCSKHIDVKYYYISEALEHKVFEIVYCPSEDNLADIFTKPLQGIKFKSLSSLLCQKL